MSAADDDYTLPITARCCNYVTLKSRIAHMMSFLSYIFHSFSIITSLAVMTHQRVVPPPSYPRHRTYR